MKTEVMRFKCDNCGKTHDTTEMKETFPASWKVVLDNDSNHAEKHFCSYKCILAHYASFVGE